MMDSARTCRPRITYILTVSMSVSVLRGLVGYLISNGWDVDVVAGPGCELNDIASEGASVFAIPMEREISPLRDLLSLWRLWSLLIRIRPNVVVAGTPKGGLLGTIAARLAVVPHITYIAHGLRLETTSGWKRKLLWATEWFACRASHEVRCVSTSLKSRMISLGLGPSEHFFVLGTGSANGIDCEKWQPCLDKTNSPQHVRDSLQIPSNSTVIGFVGRFTYDKGIRELYDAFTLLLRMDPNIRLLLVGDYETGDPLPVELCAQMNANPSVIRTGFVKNVDYYYRAMDILVLPTYREGFPIVCLEAQAASIPVVTTDATGAIDSIVDGVTGIRVPVGDVDTLTIALNRLVTDAEKRARMGQAGRAWVQQNFQRETVWRDTLEHYQSILPPSYVA